MGLSLQRTYIEVVIFNCFSFPKVAQKSWAMCRVQFVTDITSKTNQCKNLTVWILDSEDGGTKLFRNVRND